VTRYAVSPDAVFAPLEGGTVLLNLHTKRYYSLNETGAVIWAMLERQLTREEMVNRLTREYEIESAAAASAIDDLLRELMAERLITTRP
jgi:hypothetical protein